MLRSVPTAKLDANFAPVFSRTSVTPSTTEPAAALPAAFAPLAKVLSTRPFVSTPRVNVVAATLLNTPPAKAAIGAPTAAAH